MTSEYEITATHMGTRGTKTICEVVTAEIADEAVAKLHDKYPNLNLSVTSVVPVKKAPE